MVFKYNSKGLIDGVGGMLVATFTIITKTKTGNIYQSNETTRANFSNISSQRHLILNKCRDMAVITHAERYSLFGSTNLITSQSVTLVRAYARYVTSDEYKVKSFTRRNKQYMSIRYKGKFFSMVAYEKLEQSDNEFIELANLPLVRLPQKRP